VVEAISKITREIANHFFKFLPTALSPKLMISLI
jgi:hypothetical protein